MGELQKLQPCSQKAPNLRTSFRICKHLKLFAIFAEELTHEEQPFRPYCVHTLPRWGSLWLFSHRAAGTGASKLNVHALLYSSSILASCGLDCQTLQLLWTALVFLLNFLGLYVSSLWLHHFTWYCISRAVKHRLVIFCLSFCTVH